MQGYVAYARLHGRKGKLPHNRQSSRQHLVQFEIREPQAEKQGIGHRSLLPQLGHLSILEHLRDRQRLGGIKREPRLSVPPSSRIEEKQSFATKRILKSCIHPAFFRNRPAKLPAAFLTCTTQPC